MHAIASKFRKCKLQSRSAEEGEARSQSGERSVGETGDSRNANSKENENFKRAVGGICKSHYTSDREIKIARMPIGIPRISRIRQKASPTRPVSVGHSYLSARTQLNLYLFDLTSLPLIYRRNQAAREYFRVT